MEKFIVHNPTHSVISFQLKPSFSDEQLGDLAKHKVRRLVRGGAIPVAIQPHHSLDLVEFSGMCIADLQMNSELHLMLRKGVLQILETTTVETIPDEEEPEEEVVEEKEEPKEEVVEEEPPKKEEPELPTMPSAPPPMPEMPQSELKTTKKVVKKTKDSSKSET